AMFFQSLCGFHCKNCIFNLALACKGYLKPPISSIVKTLPLYTISYLAGSVNIGSLQRTVLFPGNTGNDLHNLLFLPCRNYITAGFYDPGLLCRYLAQGAPQKFHVVHADGSKNRRKRRR